MTFSYRTYAGNPQRVENGIPIILPSLENSSYIISNSINVEQLSCCCVRWIILSNAKNEFLPTRTAMFLCPFYAEMRAHDSLACVASVFVRFRSKKRRSRVKDKVKALALVPFFARSKQKIPFLGLSLLRN